MIGYDVEIDFGTIGRTTGEKVKTLRLISWTKGQPPLKIGHPKYDIREWQRNENGFLIPAEGISLNEKEARSLCRLLSTHFRLNGGIKDEN